MQTALALQSHAKSFFPGRTQSPEISNFDNIFAYKNSPTLWGYLDTPILFFKRKPVYQLVPR